MEFRGRFGDEASCLEYLAASRWPEGYCCPACGGGRAWVLERRHLWECSDCHHQTSVTAGTVMHGTRTPLRLWLWAAYLVATHAPGVSALQLQRQLGIGRYETAWLMLHKLRRAMVAPEREALSGEVEVDEAFVGGRDSQRRGGRQRDANAALVGVAVELGGRGAGRLRLQVLPDASQATLGPWVSKTVKAGAIVHTDGWDGYGKLRALGFDHRPRCKRDTPPEQLLVHAHRAVSNLKTWLHGTHRGVAPDHLQVYLDEFVFRHNRRRTPMAGFQTLLGLSASLTPTTYAQITTHTGPSLS
jgi:transposase-like protein